MIGSLDSGPPIVVAASPRRAVAAAGAPYRFAGRLFCAAAFIAATASVAVGQTNPQEPTTLTPPAGTPASPEAAPAAVGTQVIEVNPLADISRDSVGILGPNQSGFGLEMWRGTDRHVVRSILARLPGDVRSPVLRDLARRLLLSIAAAPVAQATTAQSGSLLALRVNRLMAMGEVDAVNELLAIVPSRDDDEMTARTRIEGLLLGHDAGEACRQVRNGIGTHHALPFWQKAMVFCNMLAGEIDKVMLGLDLMRELGATDDPLFLALASTVTGAEASIPDDAALTPLHFAMFEVSGRPLPFSAVLRAPPGLLVAIARSSRLDLEARALAAEAAFAAGILSGDALTRIYDAFVFTPEQLANAISSFEAEPGPRTRALMYQSARGQSLPATRAEVLRAVFQRSEGTAIYQAVVRAFLPLLLEVPASPELAWFAGTAGRALYASGRFEAAGGWLALGRQEAILNPQAATAVAALWPYSRLAGDSALTTDGSLAAWQAMYGGAADEAQARRQIILRATFQALGEQDPLPWNTLAASADVPARSLPNGALLYALEDAAESRRVGETILLALAVLGGAGPAESHVMALSGAISALSRIGLEREARALAIEAALASGV